MKKLLAFVLPLSVVLRLQAQSSSFTYQGRLDDGGSPANGTYDFTFALFDGASGGNQVGGVLTNAAAGVSNGLFAVTLDFGSGVFSGADRWMEIGVVTNGGGVFATLVPRQQVTATPYAMQAANANSAATASSVVASNILGALSVGQLPGGLLTNGASGVALTGSFAGNGGGLSNLAAANVSGVLSLAQIPGLDASNLLSGTLGLDRLPVSLVTNGATGVNFSGIFLGNGAGLSNVDLLTINSRGAIAWVGKPSGVFTLTSSPAVGALPVAVVSADINGDGKLDLISANGNASTLTILTNNGSGGFGAFSTLNAGGPVKSVIAADVNGDGKPDLVIANSPSYLTVLTNVGGGAFNIANQPGVGTGPVSVTAVDVNGDGKLDLVTANAGGASMTVLTNNGTGLFTFTINLSAGISPNWVTSADLNGDGKPDLICANNGSASLSVYTNNGSGGFALAVSPAVGSSPTAVAVADVNGDGKLDLVSANSGSGSLTVLTNNGMAGFGTPLTVALGAQPSGIAASDVNGDGKVDIIATVPFLNLLMVLTNNGSGSFTPSGNLAVGTTPVSVIAADLNGDSAVDLVSANENANTLSVLFNLMANPAPVFLNLNATNITSGTLPDARLSTNVVLENGPNTFVSSNQFISQVVATNVSNQFAGNGAGLTGMDLRSINSAGALAFTTNFNFQLFNTLGASSGPRTVALGDISGDGRLDVICANSSATVLSIFTNNAAGGFASAPGLGLASPAYSVIALDINGDGKLDLATANFNANTLTVFTNNGTGGFAVWTNPAVGSGPLGVAAADFNNDGRVDLVSANFNANTLTVLTNTIGGFVVATNIPVGSGPENVAVADMNGDGRPDLICPNFNSFTISVLTNNGSGVFAFYATISVGAGPFFVRPVDVNNDGRIDLVTANPNANTVSVCINNGGGSFSVSSVVVSSAPIALTSVDINGDGKADLITANNGSASHSVLLNNGSGGFSVYTNVSAGGSAPFSVAAADFNGDGRPDFVSANNGSGSVSFFNETAGSTVAFVGNGAALSTLNASALATGIVPDARLAANIPRLNANNEFTGTNGLNDQDLHFRNSADANHGIGWYGSTGPVKLFNGYGPDGVILYGYQGGGLGSVLGGQKIALAWNSSGQVAINKSSPTTTLDVAGSASISGAVSASTGNFNAVSASSANITGTANASSFTGSGATLTGNVQAYAFRARGGAPGSLGGNNNGYAFANNGGDNDSGMFSSADGQVEFYVNATEQMRIMGSGNVGINTTNPASTLDVNGTIAALSFVGNGGGLTNLNANQLTGIVAMAQLPLAAVTNGEVGLTLGGTFTGDGSGLTNLASTNITGVLTAAQIPGLDASKITSGSLVDARLSANVALLNGNQTFTGADIFAAGLRVTAANVVELGGGVAGKESNAGKIGYQTFTSNAVDIVGAGTTGTNRRLHFWNEGGAQFEGPVGLGTNAPAQRLHVVGHVLVSSNVTAASFTGDGSALTGLSAANLTTGLLPDARLSSNVPLLSAANVFAATNRFAGVVIATNGNNQFTGAFTGNGSGLTSLPATNLIGALPINTTLSFTGNRTNGITNAVMFVNNTNTGAAAAPALRVQNDGGTTPNGALSVSANVAANAANSVIAQFGNAASFVVTITNDGTIYSKGVALTSDRNVKESFRTVDGTLILEKVATLPMSEWDYKDTPGVRHLGPMAQDFHAAFGLNGGDDRHISVVDEGGVALAAIQGLNAKLAQKDNEIRELNERLGQLERLMKPNGKGGEQ